MTTIPNPSASDFRRSRLTKEAVASFAQSYGAAAVLAILVLVGSFTFPSFATPDNFANIATQSSFPMIIAVGMTFVILTGGIDLSVGSMYALGGVLAAYGSQWGPVGTLGLPVLVCSLIGAAQGALIAFGRMAAFIVTLAGLLGVRGLVYAITAGGSHTPLITDTASIALGQGGVLGLNWPVFVAVVAIVIGTVVLVSMRTGQAVLAVGGSENAAELMGLPVARVHFSVYVVSAVCAGLSGALTACYSSSGVPNVGFGLELSAISAVVIGGTLLSGGRGNLIGSTAGVLLLTVIQNLINQIGSLTSSVQTIVSGAFLAVVVIIQTVLSRTQRI